MMEFFEHARPESPAASKIRGRFFQKAFRDICGRVNAYVAAKSVTGTVPVQSMLQLCSYVLLHAHRRPLCQDHEQLPL